MNSFDYSQVELRILAEMSKPIPWYRKLLRFIKYRVLRRKRFNSLTGRLYNEKPHLWEVKRK